MNLLIFLNGDIKKLTESMFNVPYDLSCDIAVRECLCVLSTTLSSNVFDLCSRMHKMQTKCCFARVNLRILRRLACW